jgi:hypothetical protein
VGLTGREAPSHMDPGHYCREIETYLCRKNDGHLIRIVGPAFELVTGWAGQGIPLRVAFEGIDRFFERYYRKGPRRRPVHIAFCEGDVLEVFDAWRRATGVAAHVAPAGEVPLIRKRARLAGHLERTIVALTARRAGADRDLDRALDAAVRQLDALRATGKAPRGDARVHALEQLRAVDERLMNDARALISAAELHGVEREAEESLAPFRGRMSPAAWTAARAAAIDRAIRTMLKLPVIRFE